MTPQQLTRGMHGVIEPLHAIVYFAADVHERYAELGLEPRGQGYIAGRSAPMGPVGPHLAASVFYNFNPAMFHAALPATWDAVSPAQVLDARAAGHRGGLRTGRRPYRGAGRGHRACRPGGRCVFVRGSTTGCRQRRRVVTGYAIRGPVPTVDRAARVSGGWSHCRAADRTGRTGRGSRALRGLAGRHLHAVPAEVAPLGRGGVERCGVRADRSRVVGRRGH